MSVDLLTMVNYSALYNSKIKTSKLSPVYFINNQRHAKKEPRVKFSIFRNLLIYLSILSCAQSFAINHPQEELPFNKVVIWGHKLHSHTHSYIHYAFYRTFKHLGYDVHWFDNNDNVSQFDFSRSLFITEGTIDQKIPLRSDCFYWLHNCESTKYKPLYATGHAIIFQVYTHDCKPRDLKVMEPFILYNVQERVLYMPWGTDLLPHEIDAIKRTVSLNRPDKSVYLIGSYQHGDFDNTRAWGGIQRACADRGIKFQQRQNLSPEQNIHLIQQSYIAPAIQGDWQCRQGYIPCRIFKNISYGQFGVTNSKTVYELFGGNILYNENTYQLLIDAEKYIKHATIEDLYKQMDFVRDNHTYINRINCLLNFANMVYKSKS